MLLTLAFATLAMTAWSPRVEATSASDCRELWSQTLDRCKESCEHAALSRGVSKGQCKNACRRVRRGFLTVCRKYGQIEG